MLFSAAVLMLSFATPEWDAHASTALSLAALDAAAARLAANAEWSTLVSDLVAIGAT